MINHGIQYSATRPKEIEMTEDSVFIATNITPYSKEIEDHVINGFQYEYTQYSKDEYILKLHEDIIETQSALLTVETKVNELQNSNT